VFVFTPSVEWNFLFQRAQQLACCYAKHKNVVVFYLTEQRHDDNFFGYKEIAPRLILINSYQADKINQIAIGAKQVISFIYNITNIKCLKLYHSDKLEYEYVDDLTVSVSKTEDISQKLKLHNQLVQKADLVVTTATRLYNEIAQNTDHVILSPNAVDYSFFSQKMEIHSRIKSIIKDYSCVLEYYGALASWFDYDLINETARQQPDWLWILIGKKIDNDMERSGIEKLPNVYYIESVPYKELPSYIAGADILTIPFHVNDITMATSPVKLFEYMAAGKPILTSDMPECRKYKSVCIYKSIQDFENSVHNLMKRGKNAAFLTILDQEARDNTWDSRADQILSALNMKE
jgi:glycosyltransferase involved in cell wall biosynthesis